VFKNAKATDKYGNEGKNGVISIQSKGSRKEITDAIKVEVENYRKRLWSLPSLKDPMYIVDGNPVSAKEYAKIVGGRIESIVTLTKKQMEDWYSKYNNKFH